MHTNIEIAVYHGCTRSLISVIWRELLSSIDIKPLSDDHEAGSALEEEPGLQSHKLIATALHLLLTLVVHSNKVAKELHTIELPVPQPQRASAKHNTERLRPISALHLLMLTYVRIVKSLQERLMLMVLKILLNL